jgi:hypothetical protein
MIKVISCVLFFSVTTIPDMKSIFGTEKVSVVVTSEVAMIGNLEGVEIHFADRPEEVPVHVGVIAIGIRFSIVGEDIGGRSEKVDFRARHGVRGESVFQVRATDELQVTRTVGLLENVKLQVGMRAVIAFTGRPHIRKDEIVGVHMIAEFRAPAEFAVIHHPRIIGRFSDGVAPSDITVRVVGDVLRTGGESKGCSAAADKANLLGSDVTASSQGRPLPKGIDVQV